MRGGEQDDEVAVDATLERTLGTTEEAIAMYLQDPSPARRAQLLAALETLDQQIDSSDAYESSTIGSGAFGYSTKGSVIGETSSVSAAEEIPGAELRAQMGLVKAAKDEVRAPRAETLARLRAAQHALAAVRGQDPLVS
jgi:hypothetical protein